MYFTVLMTGTYLRTEVKKMWPFYYSLLLLPVSERDSKSKYESLKALKVRDIRRHCEGHQHKESVEAFFPNTESLIPLLMEKFAYL